MRRWLILLGEVEGEEEEGAEPRRRVSLGEEGEEEETRCEHVREKAEARARRRSDVREEVAALGLALASKAASAREGGGEGARPERGRPRNLDVLTKDIKERRKRKGHLFLYKTERI